MSEIENLLNELRGMNSQAKNTLLNNKDTWKKIAAKDLEALGFESEEELKEFILANPYSNIID